MKIHLKQNLIKYNKIKMGNIKLFLLTLLISFSIIFCDYKGVPEERIFSLDGGLELNVFDVLKEDEFYLKLHGNPTTGYSWFLNQNSDKENLLALNLNEYNSSQDFVVNSHPERMVGVGGDYFFKFKGLKEGSYNLKFVNKRSWEPNPINQKFVVIDIKSK